jgi:hypothetical protein
MRGYKTPQHFVTLSRKWLYSPASAECGYNEAGDGMLDLAGILFSSIMMMVIIIRAIQLDSSRPWFPVIPLKVGAKLSAPRSWQRRN